MSDYECPKCKTEYDACGSHEDDSGEHKCDECGFRFNVEIEYDPSYSASCVECEMGEFGKRITTMNGVVEARFCKHCGRCEIL